MGEAKRRKELGLPPRNGGFSPPSFDKKKLKKKVRDTLYKYPVIPFIFYGLAIINLVLGVFGVLKFYK